ncbi:MAG: ABC transporter permease [Deltaproteobacteria bacterium]|nr:MAG: ABC transporter permease [Deltaproteobacteria bacterium]
MDSSLENLWRRRHLLWILVVSNIKRQNKNNFLGYLWWWLDPLLMTGVYFFMVYVLFRARSKEYPYLLYLVSGILPWKALADSLGQSVGILRSHASIIRAIGFPKAVLPLSMTISNIIYFFFSVVVLLVLGLVYDEQWNTWPGWQLLWLPVVSALQVAFTAGLALLVSAAGVFFLDLSNILGHLLRMWMYLSPVIYPVSLIPEQLFGLYRLNPMYAYLGAYRDIFVFAQSPSVWSLGYGTLASVVMLSFGMLVFRRLEGKVVQRL